MTKVIAVINQKGGVGKTATTCNLAYCFAAKNKRTLLIDLDPSANASRIFLGENDPDLTVKDFLMAKEFSFQPIVPAYDSHDQLQSMSLIPSHISLALAERELGNKPFRETLLAKKLSDKSIQQSFDYILLDCPPTLTTLTINAMYAADLILIPVTYAKDALEGVGDLFDLLSEIKDGHSYDIKLLRNQYDARKKTANGHVAEKLQPFIDQNIVLKTIIRQDEEVNKASFDGLTVMVASPNCHAVQDYNSLSAEIEELQND
jgi:chromosome partitioning protein